MELIFGINPEQFAIDALRILVVVFFLIVNGFYLFAIDAPSSVTVMVTNVATAFGAIMNFALWTAHTNVDIGAMVLIIFAALGMAFVASETHKQHDGKRHVSALHNPWTFIFTLTALLSSSQVTGLMSI